MTSQIVEIVGPAGAGKSTLYQALADDGRFIRPENFPDVRRPSNAPFFLKHGLPLLPRVGLIQRRPFAWLAILRGWPELLKRQRQDGQIILLDQGPVYLLTETHEFGPPSLRCPNVDGLWQDLFKRWAGALDTVIWLDAPDEVLLERIRSREKEHVVKHESREATLSFLAAYRKAYSWTISHLLPELHILRFNTAQKSAEEIASRLLHEFRST